MNIDQITNELKNLSDKINLIDNNVKFNIQMYWAVLAVVVAILALAVYFLVKQFINHTIETELDKKLEELKENLLKEINCDNEKYYPTLMGAWRSIEGLPQLTCWKDREKYIHLEGIIAEGTENIASIRLSKGYRPSNKLEIPILSYDKIGMCIIDTDGTIFFKHVNNKYVELKIKFKP